ncbi:MAG TPA: rhodanese-like domain-containing protein [Succinivibrionaceae bacterium]|nr:rhodanese-like domain-containing protein [Succinivibrionaceae bacterium]
MFPSLWTDDSSDRAERIVIKNGISSVSLAEANSLIESGNCTLVDVREPDEYRERHIPGALNFPVDSITAQSAAKALPDKNAVILLYCLAGMRASSAAVKLSELGYRKLVNIGGISHWPYATEQSPA